MNKTALITGASSGLGLEFSKIFAKDGYDLVLVARRSEILNVLKEDLEKNYSSKVYVFPIDLTESDAAEKLLNFTEENNIFIDVLVNNAGFGDFGRFAESDLEKQVKMIELNVTALTKLCHLYMKPMLKKGKGNILNVASIASFQAGPLLSVYYATKAYVLSLTEALSVETKGTGVKFTALCPGPTKTGFEAAANLENSGLFNNLKTATSEKVASYGYKRMKKGKLISIQGFGNKLAITTAKFMPRRLVRNAVYQIQKYR